LKCSLLDPQWIAPGSTYRERLYSKEDRAKDQVCREESVDREGRNIEANLSFRTIAQGQDKLECDNDLERPVRRETALT
jgi:hypothetical protein